MTPRFSWEAAASGIFLVLAILRWPAPRVPLPPPRTPRIDAPFPARVQGTGVAGAPAEAPAGGDAPPRDSGPSDAALIGPGLRHDMEAVTLVWDELRASLPKTTRWEARATASVLANLLLDAAHQDAMWRGEAPDGERAHDQAVGHLEAERQPPAKPSIPPTR